MEHSGLTQEWPPLSCPLAGQGRMASPWEESSGDKRHPLHSHTLNRGEGASYKEDGVAKNPASVLPRKI